MTGEPRKFVSLFGGARESSDLVGIARAACREGYAVIAVKPLTKEPMCTLTERQRAQADKKAAAAARDAGVKHWEKKRHPCGYTHAITDEKEADRVFKRLTEAHPDLNIGLEVGASRLLVVDADTTAERESFSALWAQMEERPELAQAAPTVRSPGKRRVSEDDEEEVWVHKDGGHFWFLLPDHVDFSLACTSAPLKIGAHETKASLMFRNRLVLVPPSVREEGPYVMASDIQPAPAWLIERLHAHIAGHAERIHQHRERAADGDDQIADWAAVTPWEVILTPHGWTTSGRTDGCGCEIWTRPGDWSSPKSATAHEPGCGLREVTGGVLHLWTDSPPEELAGRKDWSKLQVIAAYEHGGDDRDALIALGIVHEDVELRPLPAPTERPTPDPAPDEDEGEDEDNEDQEDADTSSWAPVDLDALWDGTHEQRTPTVLLRSDGVGMFYARLTHSVHGESESGKSWIGQTATVEVLARGGRALYVDFEDRGPEVLPRLRALGIERAHLAALDYINPEGPADGSFARLIEDRDYDLAVIDGVTAAIGEYRLKSNSQDDVTQWHRLLPQWVAEKTGAAVVVIDHVSKSKDDRGRFAVGSQAKMASISGSAFYVDVARGLAPGSVGELRVLVGKDRPGGVRAHSGKMQRDRLQPFARYIHDATDPDAIKVELAPWMGENTGTEEVDLRALPRGADWDTPDQPDVPGDIATYAGPGKKAIQDLARFLRANGVGGIGVEMSGAKAALLAIKGLDGKKSVHDRATIERAWGAMVDIGRLEPADSNGSEGGKVNPKGLHWWVSKTTDPGS